MNFGIFDQRSAEFVDVCDVSINEHNVATRNNIAGSLALAFEPRRRRFSGRNFSHGDISHRDISRKEKTWLKWSAMPPTER